MKRKLSEVANQEPTTKKPRISSYEYLSGLNERQHTKTKQWIPEELDFAMLAEKYPDFGAFTRSVAAEKTKVNWKKDGVLHALAEALLAEYFDIKSSFPRSHLAPTVCSLELTANFWLTRNKLALRVNYLHWIADIIGDDSSAVWGVDIGTGASCIYPMLGVRMYNWNFVATEIDPESIEHAQQNIALNPSFSDQIETILVPTTEERQILKDVLPTDRKFSFCVCNPPFFDSLEKTQQNPKRNCPATSSELVTPGGEFSFVKQIIDESMELGSAIQWYSSMLGRKVSFRKLKGYLKSKEKLDEIRTTEFCQGRQVRWGVAWKVKESITEAEQNE